MSARAQPSKGGSLARSNKVFLFCLGTLCEDSGEFDVANTVCLVGKNEAGKSATLYALAGLNPHPSTMGEYDVEKDYPRRHLNQYEQRHSKKRC